MKFLLAVLLALSSTFCFAAEEKWVTLGIHANYQWDGLAGSFSFIRTGEGDLGGSVRGRVLVIGPDAHTSDYKWYVTIKDCIEEKGSVVSTNLDGKFLFENKYVRGDETVSAGIAEVICALVDDAVQHMKKPTKPNIKA
jgi:hypothetical protein